MQYKNQLWLSLAFLPLLLFIPRFEDNALEAACQVSLIFPAPGQLMPQFQLPNGKHQSQWEFKWSPCRGATKYHLYVKGPNAQNPAINNSNIRRTSYTYYSGEHYGITKTQGQGWKWYVRAYANGQWAPWSEMRSFNVSVKGAAKIVNTCSVQLTSPGNNARLFKTRGGDRKYYSNWTFSWTGCQNASYYQLYVIGPGAKNPRVNQSHIRSTSYTYRSSDYGVIKTEGWKWYVRPYVNGKWGEWTAPRYFGVSLK